MELRYVKAFSVSVLLWGFLFFLSSLAFRGRSLFFDGGSKGSITLSLRLAEKGAAVDSALSEADASSIQAPGVPAADDVSLMADSTLTQASFSESQPPSQDASWKTATMPVNADSAADAAASSSESVVSAVANFAATSSESSVSAASTEVSPQKDASQNTAKSASPAATDASETEVSSRSGLHSASSGEASGIAALLTRDDISALLQTEIEKRLVYPEIARQRGEQGSVTLLVFIAKDGSSFDVQVIKSAGSVLDKNAQKLVSSIIKKNRTRFAAGLAEPFSGEFLINYSLE